MTKSIPRGGHFPGHIRDTFIEAVDAFIEWEPDQPEPTVTLEVKYEPRPITISAACGLVWNCSDILPGHAFDALKDNGLEFGRRTYGAAARAMSENIRSATVTR